MQVLLEAEALDPLELELQMSCLMWVMRTKLRSISVLAYLMHV